MSISINANLFRIAYGAVSTEETRYYLNGVFVEPDPNGGVFLVSTDGHRMLVVRDAEGSARRPAIIQLRKDVLSACKSKKTDRRRLRVEVGKKSSDPATATVVSISGSANEEREDAIAVHVDCEIDGTFPDYRRVVPPKSDKQARASFNPRYISAMASIGLDLAAAVDRSSSMVLHVTGERDPALITWGRDIPAFGVLMPTAGDLAGLPGWFNKPAAQAA